jgi:hypothetical protein
LFTRPDSVALPAFLIRINTSFSCSHDIACPPCELLVPYSEAARVSHTEWIYGSVTKHLRTERSNDVPISTGREGE